MRHRTPDPRLDCVLRTIYFTVLVLGVSCIVVSPGAMAQSNSQRGTMSLTDGPLAKFAKLMPVVTHPRCINCHGVVDPFTATNHVPDADVREEASRILNNFGDHSHDVPDFNLVCLECHTDTDTTTVQTGPNTRSSVWMLAPKRVSFVGKSTGEICRLWRHSAESMLRNPNVQAANSVEALRIHLNTDPLAANALDVGNKGIDGNATDPPPMNKAKFLETAEEWLEGFEEVPCAGWEGTITQTESVNLTTSHGQVGGGMGEHTTETQTATRLTEITFGGSVNVRVSLQGSERIDTTLQTGSGGQSCTGTVGTVRSYGHPHGATKAEAKSAKVTFAGNTYRLTIVVPEEQTRKVENIKTTSSCSLGPIPDMNDTVDFDHPSWSIEIDGNLPNPINRKHLKGNKTETLTSAHLAWLTANGGNVTPDQTRNNGELLPVPVEVTTTWDLRQTMD